MVAEVDVPPPRTSTDCENAALALLDDSARPGWSGEYQAWSDFLPENAQDIFPGEDLIVNVQSQNASFRATVREVEMELIDPADDRSRFRLKFADDSSAPLAFTFAGTRAGQVQEINAIPASSVGSTYIGDLPAAAVTDVTSTTVSIDAGSVPPAGGGFEVRRTDAGWGPDNDRNLIGRFTDPNFTLSRLSRVQDYYVRQFDASSPPKYSRFSTLLHIDYPL
jgi:hypothetical protein